MRIVAEVLGWTTAAILALIGIGILVNCVAYEVDRWRGR